MTMTEKIKEIIKLFACCLECKEGKEYICCIDTLASTAFKNYTVYTAHYYCSRCECHSELRIHVVDKYGEQEIVQINYVKKGTIF